MTAESPPTDAADAPPPDQPIASTNDTEIAPASVADTPAPRRIWLDFLIGVVFALIGGLGSYWMSAQAPPQLYDMRNLDVWFQGDVGRVYWNTVYINSDQYRTNVHPLFPLIVNTQFRALAKLMHVDISEQHLDSPEALRVVRLLIAGLSACGLAVLWALLRVSGLYRLDAALFALLGGTSAFAMFWFTVPESYSWGAVGILIALTIVAIGCRRRLALVWYLLASFLTFVFTSTNWMVGCLALVARFRARGFGKAVQWSINVLFIITLLWGVQRAIFRTSKIFLQLGGEGSYLMSLNKTDTPRAARAFFVHTIVAPKPVSVSDPEEKLLPTIINRAGGKFLLSMQTAEIGSGGMVGLIASVGWITLLALGVVALFIVRDVGELRFVLGFSLLGQLVLHLFYGDETFLYCAHFGALLIPVAALGARTKLRPAVLAIVAITLVCGAINNYRQFKYSMNFVAETETRLKQLPHEDPRVPPVLLFER